MARSTADKNAAAELLANAEANTKGPVLTPEQTLVMFALVARQGFVAQNDRRSRDARSRGAADLGQARAERALGEAHRLRLGLGGGQHG